MKKVIIFVLLILGLVSVPFLGNKVIKDTIDDRLTQMQNDGLAIKLLKEEKKYLTTELIYTIHIADEKKFVRYLQQFSSKQLPPYTQSLLSGIEFGLELQYNNIPLSDKINIDIYPTKLPVEIDTDLSKSDHKLYEKLEDILKNKKILYHITYAVTSGEFSGYMKDFNENFEQSNGNKIAITYNNVLANGKGVVLAPESLKVSVEKFTAKVESKTGDIDLIVNNLHSSSNFETDTTYITSLDLDSMHFKATDQNAKVIVDTNIEGIGGDFSSNTQNKDAEVFTKGLVEHLSFQTSKEKYIIEDLQYDMQLEGLDKESYIKLKDIFEKVQDPDNQQQEQIQEGIIDIISNGFNLKVAKLYLKNFSKENQKNLGGFDINLLLDVHKDPNIMQKIQQNPTALTKNITLHTDMKFEKGFYSYLNTVYAIDRFLGKYKKEQNNQIVFDIDFIDQVFYINKQKFQIAQ